MSGNALIDARRAALGSAADCAPLIALLPYAQWLGVRMQVQGGQPAFSLPFRPPLTGSPTLPAIHGGVTAAFLETAATLHLGLMLDEQRIPKCIDFSLDYLRSAACVQTHARCQVSRLGRRVAQVQIRGWQDDPERPIAIARAHFLLADYPV